MKRMQNNSVLKQYAWHKSCALSTHSIFVNVCSCKILQGSLLMVDWSCSLSIEICKTLTFIVKYYEYTVVPKRFFFFFNDLCVDKIRIEKDCKTNYNHWCFQKLMLDVFAHKINLNGFQLFQWNYNIHCTFVSNNSRSIVRLVTILIFNNPLYEAKFYKLNNFWSHQYLNICIHTY